MREIKFKSWDTENKKWLNSVEVSAVISAHQRGEKALLYPLMQFTGLHDKNGKEIYENDVLSVDKIASLYKNCPITVIGVVVYTNGRYEVETKKVINKKFSEQSSIHFGMKVMDWIHLPEFHKSEIIGNIHENTELL